MALLSLKPTLFLAPCPESLFLISHLATWTGLGCTERTRTFHLRAAPTAAWTLNPLTRINKAAHPQEPPSRSSDTACWFSARRGKIYSFKSVTAFRCAVIKWCTAIKWYACVLNCGLYGFHLLTFEQLCVNAQCARRVWFKGSAAPWELLSLKNKASFHKSIIPLSGQASSMGSLWCELLLACL